MEDKRKIAGSWYGFDGRMCSAIYGQYTCLFIPCWNFIGIKEPVSPDDDSARHINVSATFDHGTFRMFNWIPDDKDIRFRQGIVEDYSQEKFNSADVSIKKHQ